MFGVWVHKDLLQHKTKSEQASHRPYSTGSLDYIHNVIFSHIMGSVEVSYCTLCVLFICECIYWQNIALCAYRNKWVRSRPWYYILRLTLGPAVVFKRTTIRIGPSRHYKNSLQKNFFVGEHWKCTEMCSLNSYCWLVNIYSGNDLMPFDKTLSDPVLIPFNDTIWHRWTTGWQSDQMYRKK